MNIGETIKRSATSILGKNSPIPGPSPASPDSGYFPDDAANTGISTNSNASFGTYISSITWKGWAIVIFILAILGINIFSILGRGTDEAAGIFGPIIKKITALFIGTTGQIVGTSAAGAKAVINTTADVADRALTGVENVAEGDIPNPSARRPPGPPPGPHNGGMPPPPPPPTHNDGEEKPGPGWCYIGSDSAFRSCTQIGYDDMCMSGEIFPTQETCINPTLRT